MKWNYSPARAAVWNEVLAVSGSNEDLGRLRGAFDRSSWQLRTARTVDEAKSSLLRETIGVVLCACDLSDGDWKALFEFADGLPKPPRFIVFSRHADDRLWAEVLNLGGFDVLAFPASHPEIFRAISSAWRNWRADLEEHCAAAAMYSL
jgi:DNA-binding NtrC family response regulator